MQRIAADRLNGYPQSGRDRASFCDTGLNGPLSDAQVQAERELSMLM